MSWKAGGTSYAVGYNPLKIHLSLIDGQEQIVWQKTIEGEIGNLYLHSMFSLTAGEYMKRTAKQCIRDAVKKLLEDESFWEVTREN